MSADHVPDTSGKRHHDIEGDLQKLIKEYVPDKGLEPHSLPQEVMTDPVIVKTGEFCERMKAQIDLVARQMDQRAYVLEQKAEELRTRASKLMHYGTSLTADMRSFSEMLVEYNNDVQSLALVEPKDTKENEQ